MVYGHYLLFFSPSAPLPLWLIVFGANLYKPPYLAREKYSVPSHFMRNTWVIGPISTPRLTWGSSSNNRNTDRQCRICGVVLLTGEKAGFCCGPKGNRYPAIRPLPPLPEEFETFLSSPDVSRLSRKLNLIFSFAAMESTHAFPTPGNPSFVAVAGRVYHRVRPDPRGDTAIRWMLYDGFDNASIPHHTHARDIPSSWIRAVRTSLMSGPLAPTNS